MRGSKQTIEQMKLLKNKPKNSMGKNWKPNPSNPSTIRFLIRRTLPTSNSTCYCRIVQK